MKGMMINMDENNRTIVLNKSNSDGFLDFYFSNDLDEVMKALQKLMNE